MNQRRIVIPPGQGPAYYHCVSRVVDRRVIFHAAEKEVFRSILRKLERFSGVRVVTYCLMGNHFHLLLEVPDKESMPKLTAEELLELLPLLYDEIAVETVAKEMEAARRSGNASWERDILARYERRRGDLSVFVKELKQRISIFYNRNHGRVGTLWESRFRSVLVEGGEEALAAVAAYIDLNPIRAGLVPRPEDYRWSGYGEACGAGKGAKQARAGLASIQREGLENPGAEDAVSWEETLRRYRRLLYTEGVEVKADEVTGAGGRRGMPTEETEAVLEEMEASGRAMPLAEALRRKVRYFTDGAVIGSAGFVEEVFGRLKAEGRTGPRRKSGPRKMRGADFGGLRSLRDLREQATGEGEKAD
jgi:putative transposase